MCLYVVHIETDPIYKLGKSIRMVHFHVDMISCSSGSISWFAIISGGSYLVVHIMKTHWKRSKCHSKNLFRYLGCFGSGRHHVAALTAHADELERLEIRVVVESCQGKYVFMVWKIMLPVLEDDWIMMMKRWARKWIELDGWCIRFVS